LTNQSSAAAATMTPTTSTPYCARSSMSPCTEGRHGRSYSNTAVSMDQPQPALTHIACCPAETSRVPGVRGAETMQTWRRGKRDEHRRDRRGAFRGVGDEAVRTCAATGRPTRGLTV
jgi:hypothetical protein